ncbi:hypothetical protein D3C87_1864560 [compost metagenome]
MSSVTPRPLSTVATTCCTRRNSCAAVPLGSSRVAFSRCIVRKTASSSGSARSRRALIVSAIAVAAANSCGCSTRSSGMVVVGIRMPLSRRSSTYWT